MLEEVRFLLNFKMDAQSPMSLILVGQSELWERLHLQAYAAIRQRIDLQCELPHSVHWPAYGLRRRGSRCLHGRSHRRRLPLLQRCGPSDKQSMHALPDLRCTEQTSHHR
nr:hypothetical protein [Paenibacillus turpanensis]